METHFDLVDRGVKTQVGFDEIKSRYA